MDSLLPHDDLAGTVLEKHLSVKAAAETFGYNEQYPRRLLRSGRLQGIKIGLVWLIKLASLEAHLRKGQLSRDQRWGPHGVTADFAKGVADRIPLHEAVRAHKLLERGRYAGKVVLATNG